MEKIVQGVLIVVGGLSFMLAVAFFLQLPWTLSLWPWDLSPLTYTFLGSIVAAVAASLIWVGLSRELGSLVGGIIHLIVFYLGLTVSLFLFFQQSGDQRYFIGSLVCLVAIFVSLEVFLWVRRYPIQDTRPMPRPVYISFGVFIAILTLVGSCVLLRIPNIFVWNLSVVSSRLIGWFFIGASCYFLYGLLHPSWHNACGQLWAFLAYDLVLIGPFLLRFATVSPAQLPSLVVNIAVLVYSGALAAYYLFVHKATRVWSEGRRAVTTSN